MLLSQIIEHILGHKYYAIIVRRPATALYEVQHHIFRTKEDAQFFKDEVLSTVLISDYVETVSFRSHRYYASPTYDMDGIHTTPSRQRP